MSNAKNLLKEGDTLFNECKFEDALKEYGEALEFDPFFKTAFFKKELAESKLGIMKKEVFQRSILSQQLDTYKKSRWVYRGVIIDYRNIDEKSLTKDKNQIAHKHDAFFLFYNGFLLLERREFKKSIENLNAGLSIQPNYPNAWFAMSLCFGDSMHYKAKIAYENGINSCIDGTFFYENEPEGWNNFGCALGMIGRYPEAISAFENALSIKNYQRVDPKIVQEIVLLNKAYSMYQIENFDEVFRICENILSINPASKFSLNIKKMTSEKINEQKNKKWWNFWE